ncbi:MAG: TetR/AcrR family transcriptional regulator [Candidatus Neoclostridium sp.]
MPEDKRIVKTRAILRFALQSLLASEPFETVTVKQICEAADVSRVTFYSHFPDKYALLNNLYADFFNKSLQRCLEKTRQSGTKDDARAYCVNLYTAFAEECFAPGRREFFYAVFKENGYALHAFKEFIAKGTEDLIQKLRGLYDIDLDYGQLSSLLMQSPVDFLHATAFSEGVTCEKAVALCRDYYSAVMDFVLKPHYV